ncbi:hypothetical protein A3L12_01460 [Thermococcus sp. P6]|uniref:hypothetical protein n=1 Tax=Thermococcus sp. P6 TaxID=122420 RepID=UPI000B59FFF1|nr:hypothetical protein [Thermococcus sp. P6]ASJ10054.1 hypothetical protein A3L12_01460 [Thermococcus sp. P6]
MERLKELIGKKEDKVDFVRYLITVLLTNEELYSDEVLFRDAVEEIYKTLREEVVGKNRRELVDAYETAVLLRAVVFSTISSPDELLREVKKKLGR